MGQGNTFFSKSFGKFLFAAIFAISAITLGTGIAHAANRTFTATNVGCNGNFSTTACWDTVPVAGDVLRINGTATFDNSASNLAYGNMEISRATVGSKVQWPVGGTNTLNVATVLTGSGGAGTIDMTNGGTLQIRTSWTSTNTTFVSGTGTVNWNVTGAASTLPAAITTYNNLTIVTATRVATLGVATTINGNLLITSGTLSAGASNFNLIVNGNFTNNATFTPGTATTTISGTGSQNVGGTTATTFNNLSINKTGTATLTNNVTAAANLTVVAGTFDLSTFTANRTAAGGTITVSNGATLRIGGTNTLPSNYSTKTFGASSTIEYYGTTQTVGAATYGNLIFSGSGAKSMLAGTSVAGNLSIAPTGSATASIAAGQNLSVSTLTTGGLGTINGTWGSTSSSATNQENTYFAATTGILTVTTDTRGSQTTLTATSTPGTVAYGATSTLSSSGGSGTGAVTFSAGASTGCSVAGTVLSVTNASGTCSVTATKAADKHYLSATSAAVTVTLVKANQATLTAIATPSTVAYGAISTLSSSGGSGTGVVTFSVGASTGCNITGGTTLNVIDASGTCSVTATKAADTNYNQATSAALPVTLVNPAPILNSISPTSTIAGSSTFTLTVNGTNFVPASVVNFNGVAKTTTYVSATQLTASIPDTDITTAGTYPVTVTNPAPGGGTSGSQTFTVISAVATKFALNHPGTMGAGTRAAYIVTRKDTNNNPTTFGTNVVYLYTSAASSTARFYDAPTGGTVITQVTISSGTSTAPFYYYDEVPGTKTVTASDSTPTADGATGITDATDSIIVNTGATTQFLLNHPGDTTVGQRAAYVVTRKDQVGNLVTSGLDHVYLYTTATTTGTFYNVASGGSPVTSVDITDGNSTATFWYTDTVPGTKTVTVSDKATAPPDGPTGITDATDSITFVAGATASYNLSHPGTMFARTRVGYTVTRKDSFANAVTSGTSTVYLYTNSTGATHVFYPDALSSTPITSVDISNGQSFASFYYYDDTAGTVTITASDATPTADGGAGIIDGDDSLVVEPVAVKFVIIQPSNGTADAPIAVTVQAQKPDNSRDLNYQENVTLNATGSARLVAITIVG